MEYNSFDKYIIRQSRFLIGECWEQIKDGEINETLIDSLCKDSIFREAILCASQDLYHSIGRYLEGKIEDKKKLRDFQISILQYWVRMCTRSTPFGLFASVGIGNNTIQSPNQCLKNYQAYIEADCEWIYSFIKKIEIRNYKKLFFSCNNAVYKIGKKICVPYVLGANEPERITFDATSQITQIINFCKNKSVSFDELYTNVNHKQLGKDLTFEKLFEFLVRNDVLISHLRPSPKSKSMLKDVITSLKESNIEKDILIRMESLSKKFEKYNNHNVVGGAEELLRDIICEMRSINNTKNIVKIDLFAINENNLLDKKDFLILEEFANVFVEILFNLKASYSLYDEYKDLFYGKYGEYREIPLVEMLDDTMGIGVPHSYREAKKKKRGYKLYQNDVSEKISSFFGSKYEEAILNNKAIQLDEIVDLYSGNDKGNETPQRSKPESFDLIFKLQYDERGNKIFVCNKDFGCIEAGRTVGRFTTKWKKGKEYLKNIVLNSKEQGILCDLEYIPRRLRMGNVISSMPIYDYSLSFYTKNNDKKVISLMDIYVGINNGRFYLKSKSLGRNIRVRTNNLLFYYGDSPIIRFIKEIQYDGIVRWEASIFKSISVLPHFPEIRYKSVIIRPETWIIKKSDVIDNDFSSFEICFCEKYLPKLCRYISLIYGDNDLLIDTHIEYFRRMIYLQLKRDGVVTLQKAYDLNSVDKQVYSSEVVLSFLKEEYNNMLNLIPNNHITIEDNGQRTKQVGSEWLHIKVYGYDDEDDYLINIMFPFVKHLKSKGIIDSFFFVRYAEPYRHLRIRLHNDIIIENLNIVLNELQTNVNNHVISHYELTPYDRELERYGGLEGTKIAEQIFELDSIISIKLLKENIPESLLEGLYIVSSVHYMEFFGWDFQRQSEWLEQRIDRTKYKKAWKSVGKQYIELYFNYKNCFSVNIDKILLEKRELLDCYKLVCNNDVLLQETVMSGLLHMSFNRLFGMDGSRENKLLIYTRNLAYNLRKRIEYLGSDT